MKHPNPILLPVSPDQTMGPGAPRARTRIFGIPTTALSSQVCNTGVALSMFVFAAGCDPEAATEERTAHANTVGEERERENAAPTPVVAAAPTPGEMEVAAALREPSADEQSTAPADVEITRQIREAVSMDNALSVEARTCTIVTRGAVVTLRGRVANEAERQAIAGIAHRTSGVSRVEDLLFIPN